MHISKISLHQTDQKVTVVGRVIKKSKELLQYENKSGNTMRYFNIIIGNKEEATHLKCYQKHKFSMVREGLTYRFSNVIQKTDSLWVIQTSNIGIVAPVQCSVDPVPILPENEPASGRKRTISEAIGSPQKSTVCAKIAKVSPVSLKCEGILPVRCLGLVDETSTTKVALFKDLAEQEFVEGSVVELSGLYKKTYNGKEQLVASAATQCQFLSSDSVLVEVTEEVKDLFSNDIDFGTAVSTPILEDIEVISISDMHVYEACDYDGCYKKKMNRGVCPTCAGSSGNLTCRIRIDVALADGSTMETVIFENDAKLVFGNFMINNDDPIELMTTLAENLPCNIKGHVKNNRIFKIAK